MKKFGIAIAAALLAAQALAADLNWLTDLPKAQAKAKAEHKLVMIDFTGSDWCPWCIKLRNEVFATPKFAAYAQTNLVPVEIDFPRKKQQSPELKKANQDLQRKYNIEGYPSIIVLNSQGVKVAELSYQPGGPDPFIARLQKLKP
jgi:protein disulfide-isomerase